MKLCSRTCCVRRRLLIPTDAVRMRRLDVVAHRPHCQSLTTRAESLPRSAGWRGVLPDVRARGGLELAPICSNLPWQVYEHLVFARHEHISIRALPGMAERTVRIGSAGKTFSLTAWKVRAVWSAAAANGVPGGPCRAFRVAVQPMTQAQDEP